MIDAADFLKWLNIFNVPYSGHSGSQVVVSWDGSTNPVDVTAGSGIDITDGVISLDGSGASSGYGYAALSKGDASISFINDSIYFIPIAEPPILVEDTNNFLLYTDNPVESGGHYGIQYIGIEPCVVEVKFTCHVQYGSLNENDQPNDYVISANLNLQGGPSGSFAPINPLNGGSSSGSDVKFTVFPGEGTNVILIFQIPMENEDIVFPNIRNLGPSNDPALNQIIISYYTINAIKIGDVGGVDSGVASIEGLTGDINLKSTDTSLSIIPDSPNDIDLQIAVDGITTNKIADNQVTNDKIRQSLALSILGNSTNATANVSDISAASDFQIFRRSGTSIGFGPIDLSQPNAVENSLNLDNGGTNSQSSDFYSNGSGKNGIIYYNNTRLLSTSDFTYDPTQGILSILSNAAGPGIAVESTFGSSNVAFFSASRASMIDGSAQYRLLSSSSNEWTWGTSSGSQNLVFMSNNGSNTLLTMNYSTNDIIINSGNLILNDVSKTIQINSLNLSQIVATDTNKKLVSVNLSGDVNTSGLTTTIANNAVSNAKFRQSSALSVVGNSTNATANVSDISAASDFQIFRRSGTSIGFGSIDLSQSNSVGSSILSQANGGTSVNASAYGANRIIFQNSSNNGFSSSTNLTFASNILTVSGPGSSNNAFNSIAFFKNTSSVVAGNLYAVCIDKQNAGSLILGINKDTATGSIPGNGVFISTFSATQGLYIGRGDGANLPNTADISINTSGNVLMPQDATVERSSSANVLFTCSNTGTNLASNAYFQAKTGSGTSGDSAYILTVTGGTDWHVGLDNSDSDCISIGNSFSVGTNQRLKLTTGGDLTVSTGDLFIGTAGKGLNVKSAAVSAGTANAFFITGVTLVGGTITINNSVINANCTANFTVTANGGTPGTSYRVVVGSGSVTITSTSALDTSTGNISVIKGF